MAISMPPAAPSPGDTQAQHSTKAYAIVAYLSTFVSEANSTADEINGSASTASTKAGEALSHAGTANSKASEASGSALLAQDWATKTASEVVSGQGYGAKKYAQDAASSASTAATLLLRYQGVLASDPALNKTGGALVSGDWYINSTSWTLRAWNGSSWKQAASASAGVSSINGLTGDVTGFIREDSGQILTPGDVTTSVRVLSTPTWLPLDGSSYLRASYPQIEALFSGGGSTFQTPNAPTVSTARRYLYTGE